MDINDIIKMIHDNDVVKNNIPIEMQLGLPLFDVRNGKLCLCFKPHREKYHDKKIYFYKPQYIVSFVYPFQHLIEFRNLTFYEQCNCEGLVCSIDEARMLKEIRYRINEIYSECNRLLSFVNDDGTFPETAVKKYQKLFNEQVEEIGIKSIYQ